MIQNGVFLAIVQLFQYLPTEVVQIDSEWPIMAVLQLFQYFPTKVVRVDLEWPILTVLQLFQYFPTEVVQICLLYTSPSPRDATLSRMPSSA